MTESFLIGITLRIIQDGNWYAANAEVSGPITELLRIRYILAT
jgi:hypothetical protein